MGNKNYILTRILKITLLLVLIIIIDLACGAAFLNLKSYSEKIGINLETLYFIIIFIIVISIICIIKLLFIIFKKIITKKTLIYFSLRILDKAFLY
ncbi:hypothetical protein CQA69_05380 [Campylobacter estrildidarum]|uniref:Uncharacterized protein n=1 Tax=Campylobacter estrildidarum TaxID=2510189 RepID=A0A4U7BP23_9BACT|nr:hypothetical protein CQA69_05380 [Campylobacter estrildidarum]